jgi:hypothetical protein
MICPPFAPRAFAEFLPIRWMVGRGGGGRPHHCVFFTSIHGLPGARAGIPRRDEPSSG